MQKETLKCHICGKVSEHWIKLFPWVFVNGEMVNIKIHLCEKCGNILQGLLQNIEATIITLFLTTQGVEVKNLPRPKFPTEPK